MRVVDGVRLRSVGLRQEVAAHAWVVGVGLVNVLFIQFALQRVGANAAVHVGRMSSAVDVDSFLARIYLIHLTLVVLRLKLGLSTLLRRPSRVRGRGYTRGASLVEKESVLGHPYEFSLHSVSCLDCAHDLRTTRLALYLNLV